MGRYRNTGLFKFKRKDKEDFIVKYELNLSKDYELEEGIKELEKAGVKFKREEVKFVIRDQNGQLIWLENGNFDAGLKHIKSKHNKQLIEYFKINEEELATLLKEFLIKGEIIYQIKNDIGNGKEGYERLCKYKNSYLLFAIGLNGFIVSTFIKNEKEALKLKELNKNEKK